MKKFWNFFKYVLVLGAGIGLAYFVLFRDNTMTVPVRLVSMKERQIKRTVSASGEVKAENQASLSFPVLGTVASLEVAEGDYVEKGARIASLSAADTYFTLEAAEDAVDVAERDRELFIENYSTNLSAIGGEDEYYIQLRKYNELVEKARASYKSTQQAYYKNFLYAPFSGLILDTYVKEGETVTVGGPVVKLADPESLYFEVTLDQEDYGLILEGQKADVELDSYEDLVVSGTVKELPKYANGGSTPNFTVKINLQDPEGKVLLGMTGDARIIVDQTNEEVSAVLYDELFFDNEDRPYIWTLNADDVIFRKYVEIGLEGDLYTEIKSNVEERVVVPQDNSVDLEEGYKAKITNE